MAKNRLFLGLDEPLRHNSHARPKTRREFLAQGFTTGAGVVAGTSTLGSLLSSSAAADVPSEVIELCQIGGGTSKVPFIAFDLAGGANTSGSNVLVGGAGGQMDFLSTAGYARQGLPGDQVPGVAEPGGPMSNATGTSNGDHTDTTLGLAFHSDSAFLRGILEKVSPECAANVNGFVMAARSENDTGNNPHNPIRGINLVAKSKGDILHAVASRNNDMGGGNSRLPTKFMGFNEYRETKVDRRTDALGLVKVGDFNGLSTDEVVSVMTSVWQMSKAKLSKMDPQLATQQLNDDLKFKLQCVYAETAHLAREYPDPRVLDIAEDSFIASIFPGNELNDGEFQKTASIMKLVIGGTGGSTSGYAGVGHISMGGYDYHGQGRATGEVRDLRAGRCMGACLEYAHRMGVPLMLVCYSDGSLSAGGQVDNSENGRGKFMWTSDNSNTRSQFALIYDPAGRPVLRGGTEAAQATHQQIGHMRADGNVETSSWPGANSAEIACDAIVANYMALHGLEGDFASLYAENGLTQSLGSGVQLDRYLAFERLPSVNAEGNVTTSRPSSDIILL